MTAATSMTIKASLYVRVSTWQQNAELQRRELRSHASGAGWEVVQIYEDVGTARSDNRPALQQLLKDAGAGKFQVVAVWKLDRFGRSLAGCLRNIEHLSKNKVRFVAITQGIDTDRSNPAATFALQILGAAAEFERSLIQERATAGLQRYKNDYDAGRIGKDRQSRSGKNLPPGRPRAIFDRDRAAELRAQGLSLREVAEQLGVGLGTVSRAVKKVQNGEQ